MKPSLIAAALRKAGYRVYTDRRAARKAPCCVVLPDGVKERRLPMGRWERQSRFTVTYYPEPMAEAIGFAGGAPARASGEGCDDERARYPLYEFARLLELVKTPDGPVRGRGMESAVKDGAAVLTATYTEILREAERRKPKMGSLTMTTDAQCAPLR